MNYTTDLINKLKGENLTDSSISLYVRNLKKLNNNEDIKNLKFLENINDINEIIKTKKDNTQRAYYISIVAALRTVKQNKKYLSLYNKYYKLMKDKALEINKKPTEEMTPEMKENWVSWEKVKELWEELKLEVDKMKNDKSVNEFKYNKLLKFVILSLYVLSDGPRRNEFQFMKILNNDNKDEEYNFIDMKNKEFIFKKYKTVKKYGEQILKINDELFDILKLYLKFKPNNTDNYLLVYFNGKPLNAINGITRILNSIQKNMGSSMLRHSYITKKYGKIEEEQKQTSQNMAHSVDMQRGYIKNPNI